MNADLLTVDQALRAVLERVEPRAPHRLPLSMARGCTLAQAVAADGDSPPFDKSIVDGVAVRTADLADGLRSLHIVAELLAGTVPTRPLGRGEAALIMTGAPVPEGADAVIMIENTRREGDTIVIQNVSPKPSPNILRRGSEMKAGDVVLAQGERLSAVKLGVLASTGCSSPVVMPVPQVAIVPTGDELVEPDQVLGPGQIRNSNAVVLEALVAQKGAIPLLYPIARDEPTALGAAFEEGLNFDVLLITGGVSAGQRDLVPETLARLGVERVFHKVRVKPGKPLWFGVGPKRDGLPGTLVFGLPGNPVSGIVGFLLFVCPALEVLAGSPVPPRLLLSSHHLAAPFTHRGERSTFHPARFVFREDADPRLRWRIDPLPWAGSADLLTVARADGFAHFPAGDRTYAAGDVVDFLPLG